jgi:hypothetical protein
MGDKLQCCVQECGTKVLSKNLCGRHYQQWKRGRLEHPDPIPDKPAECTIGGCGHPPVSRDMCGAHYRRWRLGKDLDKPLRTYGKGGPCSVGGCEEPPIAKGMCYLHWARQKRGADLDAPIYRRVHTEDLLERLRLYAPEGKPDECWEWTRGATKGYGHMCVGGGRQRGAHVVAWEIANNYPLPDGMIVRHSCDNPPCTNPAHLLLGTHADNVADKMSRGRHANNVLTAEDVREIRKLRAAGVKQKELAERFGVSQAHISGIISGRFWRNIT